jgi:hypothetical protein
MNSYFKLIEISQEKNPELGMYVHICKVINKSKLPRRDLLKIFNKVMPKDEFDRSERVELINYLETLANEPYNIRN